MINDSDKSVTQENIKVNTFYNHMTWYFRGDSLPRNIKVPNYFVTLFGCPGTAILLAQLLFRQGQASRADGYFWKSFRELEEETGIPARTLQRYEKKLREYKFFSVKLLKANGKPTNHYKIDLNGLASVVYNHCKSRGKTVQVEYANRKRDEAAKNKEYSQKDANYGE